MDGEAAAHQGVDVVDLGAIEVHGAEIIDEQADAIGLDDLVAILGALLDGHAVLQTGASSRRDKDAQRALGGPLLGQEILELSQRPPG